MKRQIRSIRNANVIGKRVLLRADLNVSLGSKGKITNDERLRLALPTIKFLVSKKARVILMSHLGRPGGKKANELSMDRVGVWLSKLLKKKVKKINYCIGSESEKATKAMTPGEVLLLENLRFYKGEEKNDAKFAKGLAALGDIYVNDAFAASHRKHASVHRIASYLPSFAGLLLEKEINELDSLLKNPKRPFIAILGGAKVSDKLSTIKNLLKKADKVLVGGAMVFTFYRALGLETGNSIVDRESIKALKPLLKNKRLVLAPDVVIAKGNKTMNAKMNKIPAGWKGVDIGPESIRLFEKTIGSARTIVWNGPAGMFENDEYAGGTKRICRALAKAKAKTFVGGGDTIAACSKFGILKKISYVSSGGGAMLEFLAGKGLPGIKALIG